jgi:hypothetical protein
MMLSFTGCSGSGASGSTAASASAAATATEDTTVASATASEDTTVASAAASEDTTVASAIATDVASPDTSNPQMTVDKANKTVTIPCQVNGKYFTEATRHGIVFKDGSNGEKSVLRSLTSQFDFYNALIEIGATPGNNLTMDDMNAKSSAEGKAVQGDPLEVTVKWGDTEVPFSDIITSSVTPAKPMDIRFGGNLDNAKSYKTGCILCLDSCAVGITSNATYPTGSTQNKEVEFHGNKDVLPADGTLVYVTFKLNK